jgi:hypothetical protein
VPSGLSGGALAVEQGQTFVQEHAVTYRPLSTQAIGPPFPVTPERHPVVSGQGANVAQGKDRGQDSCARNGALGVEFDDQALFERDRQRHLVTLRRP